MISLLMVLTCPIILSVVLTILDHKKIVQIRKQQIKDALEWEKSQEYYVIPKIEVSKGGKSEVLNLEPVYARVFYDADVECYSWFGVTKLTAREYAEKELTSARYFDVNGVRYLRENVVSIMFNEVKK